MTLGGLLFAQLLKNGFKWQFTSLVPKITAIVHAMPTKTQPTPSARNHEHNRVSDFVPIASLLEWQWRRIVMRNAGSTQMQTQSYRARQSRNLARKVRNAFPGSTALIN